MFNKTIILFTLLLSAFNLQAQTDVFENEVSRSNGKLYFQSKPLSGTLYSEQDGIPNDCDCTLKAHYKNGLLNGLKQEWYSNGKIKYSGKYSDGNKTGIHQTYYKNGKVRKKEVYDNGIALSSTLYNMDGSVKGGHTPANNTVTSSPKTNNPKPNYYPVSQEEVKVSENTTVTTSSYQATPSSISYTQNGLQRRYYPNGKPERVSLYKTGLLVKDSLFYKSGKKQLIKKFNDGELIHLEKYNEQEQLINEENYENNKKHGLQKENYPDGKIKSIKNYKNGMLEHQESFNKEGVLVLEESFRFDKKNGSHKYYNDQGKLVELKEYNMDVLTKHEVYTDQGKELINISDDLAEIKTYNNNDILIKMRYEKGANKTPDSLWIDFEPKTGNKLNEIAYDNGKIIRKGSYLNNKKHGYWINYYKDGTKESKTLYDAGELISTETLTYAKQIKNNYKEGDILYAYKSYLLKEKKQYILVRLDSITNKSREYIKNKILESITSSQLTKLNDTSQIAGKELFATLQITNLKTRVKSKKNENKKFVYQISFDIVKHDFASEKETKKNFYVTATNAKNTNINSLYRKDKKEAFFETLENLGGKMTDYINYNFPLTALIQKKRGENTIYLNVGDKQHVKEDDLFNVLNEDKQAKAQIKIKKVFNTTAIAKTIQGETWLTNYFKTHKNPQVIKK